MRSCATNALDKSWTGQCSNWTPEGSADRVGLVHHDRPMPELGGWAMTGASFVWVSTRYRSAASLDDAGVRVRQLHRLVRARAGAARHPGSDRVAGVELRVRLYAEGQWAAVTARAGARLWQRSGAAVSRSDSVLVLHVQRDGHHRIGVPWALWACGLSAVSSRARTWFTGRPRRPSCTVVSASRSKLVIEISARSSRLLAETEISSSSSPLATWAAGCSIRWTGTCLASW
jgi:hypothetical protein